VAAVSVSVAFQLLIVYGQGRKRGTKRVVKEALIVLSGLKPAVDAYRVVSGAKMHADDSFDPMFELVASKLVVM
jgi:hypothetical protein